MSVSAFIYGTNVFPTLVSGLMQLSVPTKREKSFEVQNLFAPDQRATQSRASAFFKHLERENKPLQTLLTKALLSPASKEIKPFFAVFKRALFKERGYVPRLFSDETWKEWTENRTDLGKIVSLFRDCIESRSSIDTFTKKLETHVLQKANEEANALLKGINSKASMSSCMSGFLGGTAASLLTKNPLPILVGLSGCFPSASAQQKVGSEFQVNTYTSSNQERPSVTSMDNGNYVVTWQSLFQDGEGFGVFGQS